MYRLLLFLFVLSSCVKSNKQNTVQWNQWSADVFERAKKENKLVLLDLKANWCHWCHVMDDSTYGNSDVIEYLNKNFISVEADHDARPDLAARYRPWGWPATIIFNANGEEILKHAGFVNPPDFLNLLEKCVENPVAEESTENEFIANTDKSYFATTALPLLKAKSNRYLDFENGGFKRAQKSIDWYAFEYALHTYKKDTSLLGWLEKSVANAHGIMDEAWGGVYQYSTFADWNHPHYEKLLSVQARYIKMYTWYAKAFSDDNALKTAEKIADYCFRFLWNEGKGFYSAQDADLVAGEKGTGYFELGDKERMKKGIPAIDKHIFTSNNGMMVRSLIILWGATGKEKYLESAKQIVEYMLKNRRTDDGGFWHDDNQNEIIALADNSPMADALLMMYRSTGEKKYLDETCKTAAFIHKTFATGKGNYQSDKTNNGLKPQVVLNENIDLCRFFNLLWHISEKMEFKRYADSIFTYLSSESLIKRISTEPGIMMAYEELQKEPLAGTFLVFTETEDAKNVVREMISYPEYYFSNHTYVPTTIPNDKKEIFSSFDSNVLFFCTSMYCSSPVSNVEEVKDFLYKTK
ncbi:MAG: DUF255 domain-containing protein [Flavobacteriales bacterium]